MKQLALLSQRPETERRLDQMQRIMNYEFSPRDRETILVMGHEISLSPEYLRKLFGFTMDTVGRPQFGCDLSSLVEVRKADPVAVHVDATVHATPAIEEITIVFAHTDKHPGC